MKISFFKNKEGCTLEVAVKTETKTAEIEKTVYTKLLN